MILERRIDRLEAILNETPNAKTRLQDVVDLKKVPTPILVELRDLLRAKKAGGGEEIEQRLTTLLAECVERYGKER